jgi:DNA-binding transcriptional LysR family regulator
MNIFQLNCFLSVADCLSFAKAARKMNISQPAITHQIKALEEELNVKLFHRSTRVVELTLEGQAFVSDARSMVSIAERAKLRFQDPEERPTRFLSVGGSSYHHLACLTESLHHLSAQVSDLHPRLQVAHHDQLFHMLENGSLDVVFEIGEEAAGKGDMVYKELCRSPIVCACRTDSPLAERQALSVQELQGEPLILCDPLSLSPQGAKMQLTLAEGRTPSEIHFSSSVDASVVMALAGFGSAILPDILIAPGDGLIKVPILDPPTVTLGMFYKPHPGDDLLRQFVQMAKKSFQSEAEKASGQAEISP